MKFSSLAQFACSRLEQLPPALTRQVAEALRLANARAFGLFVSQRTESVLSPPSSRSSIPGSPESPHALGITTLPPITVSDAKISALAEEPPTQPTEEPLTTTEDPATAVTEQSEFDLFLTPRKPQAVGETSRTSLRTTELTQDFLAVDAPALLKKQQIHQGGSGTGGSGLDEINRRNEGWGRKQQAWDARVKENEECLAADRERKEKEDGEQREKVLAERRKKLIEKREATKAARAIEQQRLRDSPKPTKSIPLYRRLESDFQARSDQREAEIQHRLQEIHASLSPIQVEDWRKHDRWYAVQRTAILQERKAVRIQEAETIAHANKQRSYFHSPIARVIAAEEQAQAELRSAKLAQARELRLKQRQYACLAQEIHKPVAVSRDVSPIGLAKKLIRDVRRASPSLRMAEEPQGGRRIDWKRGRHIVEDEQGVSRSFDLKQRFRVKRKSVRKSESEVLARSVERRRNYLREQRQNWGNALRVGALQYRPGLLLDEQTRDVHQLRLDAIKLGRKAVHHDSLLRHLDDDLDSQIQACGSVSAMYVDSIRAKLRVINSFSELD